jgi:transposase
MIQLDEISLEELRSQLEEVEGKVPTQRVLTAIGSKLGNSTEELAELHDVSEQTIRNWLNRFKEQPIDQAPYDDSRPGRPPKLTDDEKEEFIADLHDSPEEFGYDRQVWFPILAYHHLKDKFDVEYSLVHIRRMMREAGLSWRTARPRHYDADPEEEAEFQETVEKKPPG